MIDFIHLLSHIARETSIINVNLIISFNKKTLKDKQHPDTVQD